MKVCLLTHYYPDDVFTGGGGAIVVEKIAQALKRNGTDVFVISTVRPQNFLRCLKFLKPRKRYKNDILVYEFYPFLSHIFLSWHSTKVNIGIVFTLLFGILWNPWTYLIVRRILKKENPDVVHSNCTLYLSLAGLSAAKTLNIPVVHTVHDFILLSPDFDMLFASPITRKTTTKDILCKIIDKIEIYAKINKYIFDKIPKIVTSPSKHWIDSHLKYGFFQDCEIIEFQNLFEIKKFNEVYKNRKHNKHTFDILFVGGFRPSKGVDVLIKAFKRIQNKNIRLHIVGSGSQSDYLHRLAGKHKGIIFYGEVKNSDILKFYEFADVSVFPYRGISAFGRVVVESLAAGVPPIVTKMPDTSEKIIEGYNGFLFEQENIDQLRDILEYLISNPEKVHRMANNCVASAEKYDIEKNIGKWEEIYKKAIKKNASQ